MLFLFAAFQAVQSTKVTENRLMTNFLHLRPVFGWYRVRRYFEDIVVVMDGSGSIGGCEFKKGKKALKYMMELAKYYRTYDTKYAAVTFASSATVNFKFLPYASAANKIMGIYFPSGSTNTQAGLELAKILFDDPLSGTCFGIIM